MTIEQRDKYAYELMVKNNPEEAVKQLLLKDKEKEELKKNQRYCKKGVFSLEYDKETLTDMVDDLQQRIDKAIKYCEESSKTIKSEYFSDVIKILKGDIL